MICPKSGTQKEVSSKNINKFMVGNKIKKLGSVYKCKIKFEKIVSNKNSKIFLNKSQLTFLAPITKTLPKCLIS
jgi:hypothetical protein